MATYKPETLPRQGELNAWMLFFVASAGAFILSLRTEVPQWAWFLVAILLFSSASISLGNWMDRQTSITLEPNGVQFMNGLRNVHFSWSEITQVKVSPARWGRSVQVIGQQAFFTFSTLGEMKFRDDVKGRTGFEKGEEILSEITSQAGLQMVQQQGPLTTYTRTK